MDLIEFYVDIEDAAGNRYGSGPLRSATGWTYTARVDRAGAFSFSFDATDPQREHLKKHRVVRGWARTAGGWINVGAGIVGRIGRKPGADGATVITVSGDSLERELAKRTVGDLVLDDGSGGGLTHALAVAEVAAVAPDGWTFDADPTPGNVFVYGRFSGASVLFALGQIAKRNDTHWAGVGTRQIEFASSFASSGLRATKVDAGAVLGAGVCAIESISVDERATELITRIYPHGAGNGDARLTLAATTRTAPTGFTVDLDENWIEYDAAVAEHGRQDGVVPFNSVSPISNTEADVQAAADMLFDLAISELRHRADEAERPYYALTLADCDRLLRPLQSMVVDYHDPSAGLAVAGTLNILEATWKIGKSGLQTTGLVVSANTKWPDSDVDAIVSSMEEAQTYQAHPQANANAYTTGYNQTLDKDTGAAFRVRLGNEIVQLDQVLFEFQILPLESTVKAVAGETVTSASGSSHSHNVANHKHSVEIDPHNHGVPDHQHKLGIGGGTEPTYDVGFGAAGTAGGLVSNASGSDFDLPTNSDSGAVTTDNGGGQTVTSEDGGGQTSSTESAHTHGVTPVITTEYGKFQDSPANTFAIADLQFRINGGSWADLDTAEDAGGYWALDLTTALQSVGTFRPAQVANLLEIESKGADKRATIDGFLSVRTQIQAIRYTN